MIESNKVVIVESVRHEIDIYVVIERSKSYQSIFIFECKNWKDPVDKKEIIDFSEKIRALQAQKGFFVAPKLSSSAEAQAKLDKRIEIVRVSDDFKSPFDDLELQAVVTSFHFAEINLKERGVEAKEDPDILQWKEMACSLDGKRINFEQFFVEHAQRAITDDYRRNRNRFELEGNHNGRTAIKFSFSDPNEFVIGEIDVEFMILDIRYLITVKRPSIRSRYEIENRGRVFYYEPIFLLDLNKKVEIQAVQRI